MLIEIKVGLQYNNVSHDAIHSSGSTSTEKTGVFIYVATHFKHYVAVEMKQQFTTVCFM